MTVRVAGPPPARPLPAFDQALLEVRARTLLQQLGHGESELSISLVGDEEMVGLVRFQHGYGASARVITTVDEMMETVLGMV